MTGTTPAYYIATKRGTEHGGTRVSHSDTLLLGSVRVEFREGSAAGHALSPLRSIIPIFAGTCATSVEQTGPQSSSMSE